MNIPPRIAYRLLHANASTRKPIGVFIDHQQLGLYTLIPHSLIKRWFKKRWKSATAEQRQDCIIEGYGLPLPLWRTLAQKYKIDASAIRQLVGELVRGRCSPDKIRKMFNDRIPWILLQDGTAVFVQY